MRNADAAGCEPVEVTPELSVVLLFPGQGSQHPGMAVGLYRHQPVFTAAMDEVFDALGAHGEPVRADWLADNPVVSIDHVTRSQILLFAIDYALGRLVLSWGIQPVAMLGHSVGEVAAATLAGVFRLSDAVRLLWDRVTRLAAAPPGGMLAVAATVEQLRPYLHGDVVVGAVNAPRQTIVAGPAGPLQAVAAALRDDGFILRTVPASAGYHSPCLDSVAAGSEPLFAGTAMVPPRMTVYSGYTGSVLSADQAVTPAFWARQPAAPVLFWPALDRLLAAHDAVLCEAGPAQALTTVARRHPAVASGRSMVVPLLPARPCDPLNDRRSLAAARALMAAGHVSRSVAVPDHA